MPTAEQAELQNRLRTLSQRLEELSALPSSAGHSEEFVSLFQEKRRLEAELHATPEPHLQNRPVDKPSTKALRSGHDSDTVLTNVNRELRRLEKRDGELWLIATATGILVGAGLLAVLLPAAFLQSGSLHFEITVSKELVCGLLVLLILANVTVRTAVPARTTYVAASMFPSRNRSFTGCPGFCLQPR